MEPPSDSPSKALTSVASNVRYGRYTLVNTTPLPEQHDLLLQIVEVHLPASPIPTVEVALQGVMNQSGYRLCPQSEDLALRYRAPLPTPHRQLGPMTLRDALTVLAGPAWRLQIDALQRSVCFIRSSAADSP